MKSNKHTQKDKSSKRPTEGSKAQSKPTMTLDEWRRRIGQEFVDNLNHNALKNDQDDK